MRMDFTVYFLIYSYLQRGRKNVVCSKTKSFSEELILESVNPQYDDRLLIELQVLYKEFESSEHVKNMLCKKIVLNVKTEPKNIFCAQHVLDMI